MDIINNASTLGNIFIFGAGYSACHFAKTQTSKIFGTTRSNDKFELLQQNNITPLLWDPASSTSISSKMAEALRQTTHLIISIAPDTQGDPVLNQAGLLADMPNLAWIGYLSTIGVYGDHHGEWIDETALCHPPLIRNQKRLDAEKAWQNFADKHQVPLAIMRLSGIYGPKRNPFVKLAKGTARRIIKKDQVFNRIHVDDIAGALAQFVKTKQAGLFNVSDVLPAPPQDVIDYAADVMGIEPPAEIAFEDADLSPMARTFYGDNKRIQNDKLKGTGYHFLYPDYKIALHALFQNKNWVDE